MELKDIVSVAGEPGLHHVKGRNKNGLIVETIGTGRKFSTTPRHRVSVLSDIAIFTEEGEAKLWQVLKSLKAHEDAGNAIPDGKADADALRAGLEAVLPDYSREKVYPGDMKKLFGWYQMLKSSLDFDKLGAEETEETDEPESGAEKPTRNAAQDKAAPKKVKTSAPKPVGGVKAKTTTPRKMGS
ncbi:MAG: DUF5606 domain-containing protein [Bacteroidetes bacterium]|nr:DUF5606 domain-containing protein [Bacteroidota bacterium]